MQGPTREWVMECDEDGRIREVKVGGRDAWCMYGPAYFSSEFSEAFLPLVDRYYHTPGTEQFYWEDVLIRHLPELPPMYINAQPEDTVYEFENLEELRQFDERYRNHSGSRAMQLVSGVFRVPEADIINIRCLKAGMTNKSWCFTVKGKPGQKSCSFICRIPGPGTEKLINRREEAAVYQAVGALGITEELLYFDPETGYKISRYYEGARNADFSDPRDRAECMALLRTLHNSGIRLGHRFDIRERLRFYENLCREAAGNVPPEEDGPYAFIPFSDYAEIRAQAAQVLRWLSGIERPETICHIDSVNDNFIFTEEGLRMIDWEYCGMADPLIDIGMSAIYSGMTFPEARELLRTYRGGEDGGIAFSGCTEEEAFRIVTAYMGLGGLLWALWCVYKMSLGEQFGEYTLRMYRYFKDAWKRLGTALPDAG